MVLKWLVKLYEKCPVFAAAIFSQFLHCAVFICLYLEPMRSPFPSLLGH